MKLFFVFILVFLSVGFNSFSQTLTKDIVISGLTGKWRLEYKNENLKEDTTTVLLRREIKLKKNQKGKEIGYFKDGTKLKSTINWVFIDSENEITIEFIGGFWINEQEFIINKITAEKITMLCCDKHDDCIELYFIRE